MHLVFGCCITESGSLPHCEHTPWPLLLQILGAVLEFLSSLVGPSGPERAKRTRFLEGLNEELYQMVLTSKPKTYAKAVDSAIDIEEGLRSRRVRRQQAPHGGRPAIQGARSSQSSQSAYQPQQQQQPQVAQHSGRQRFRPRGQQFKKKSGSGSSGSGSSSSSGSRTEFCGFCGGKHPSTQCVGVQGSCNLCGQYGHFARVCPSAGSQQTAA
ncbi:hypothetical protein F511_36549 [Dorcoceras hygrometricum]|uniref:CCHC-type domain-containing protein n=1 Tax=Dorcoceras hygrometricum TaxID=472368 RepID=A0A2Z7CDI4_9LAMI|nr:hypothetical protein F511_36549 [Dorcoceras hygrometricum]